MTFCEARTADDVNPFDPVLDKPHSLDYDALPPNARYPLANQDLRALVDGSSDLCQLEWPWAGVPYAKSVEVRISDLQDDEFMPLVTQFYPGYQETIYGAEGMIVTKRIATPYRAAYERAILWMLECQAEGDRLLRLEVRIDWGQPLEQRIVDGLLVAQHNPRAAQGIYAQRNADSTRVFGNPHGRPDLVELSDPSRARLVYHVLVNGIVEVPLILTVSDVGEQVAWNGFLALRDSERAFEQSVENWGRLLAVGRLWTPDPRLNRAVQAGRIAAIRQTPRLRTGFAPADLDIRRIPALVDAFDVFDPVQSRNLLAHLRRLAERTGGSLPLTLPQRARQAPADAGPLLGAAVAAYLHALAAHLARHGDDELLAEHFPALRACADALISRRAGLSASDAELHLAFADAARLALLHRAEADAARWQSEAAYHAERSPRGPNGAQELWTLFQGWQVRDNGLWSFSSPWIAVESAGRAVWDGSGIARTPDGWAVAPAMPSHWLWWALLALPLPDGPLSLVWDGVTLHANRPVRTDLPLALHSSIRMLHTDEHDFRPEFDFSNSGADSPPRFRPDFMRSQQT